MAAQTVSTSKNMDDASIAGLLNGDAVTVDSGATLTINSDSRWGQQAANPGSIALSSVTGGNLLIDGRDVWWIPYDGGTGNVPSLGTVGTLDVTRSAVSVGEFLGVFTALGVAPSTAGGAMPVTGFIKLRRKTTTFADNDVLTFTGGATATINSTTGGQLGWIHVVGTEAGTLTVPRLGNFTVRGGWFELGTTSGASDQTIQFPVADVCPAIWVETGSGTGIFEKWLCAGDRFGNAIVVISQDVRGKFFGCTTGGVITIAKSGATACGYLPPAGCRIRIPNVIASSATSATPTVNTQNTTLSTRYDFTTSQAGVIDIEYFTCNWYLSLVNTYSVTLSHSSFADSITFTEIATAYYMNDVAVGILVSLNTGSISLAQCPDGGTMNDVRAVRYASTSGTITTTAATDVFNASFVNVQSEVFPNTTGATHGILATNGISLTRCADITVTNCIMIGCRFLVATCNRVRCTGMQYADIHIGTTNTTVPWYAYTLSAQSADISIDGFSAFAGLANVHPYSGIADVQNCQRVTIRNIGSSAIPYDMGSVNACGLIYNEVNNVDVLVQRCWTNNARLAVAGFANESKRTKLTNVRGSPATTYSWATSDGTLLSIRGANGVAGQTACYGSHWHSLFTADTTGRLVWQANEPSAATLNIQYTVTAGTPRFSGGGSLLMPTLGDQVVFTTPRKILGHTGFANIAPTYTGTSNGTNVTWEYALDTGSGYGAWKALTGANLSAETISATSGFMMKWRATTVVANSLNAAQYTRIDTITDASSQNTLYPLANPTVGYTTTQTGSVLSVWDDTTGALLSTGVYSAGITTATPDWSSDYSAVLRLRKPGWGFVENTQTVTEAGFTIPATQTDTTIPDTSPGALGITVTNHGVSPVTWQGKQWSITITTTNDALTSDQICNYLNYNISQIAVFNGFSGHAWPNMVVPEGSACTTLRGRLMGSAGATLKGIRVVRSDGTTAVPGFSKMTADDGTFYTPPLVVSFTITNLIAGSQVVVYNTGTTTERYRNNSTGTSITWTEGYTSDATVDYTIQKVGYLPIRVVGSVVSSSAISIAATQIADRSYIASSGLTFGTTATVTVGTKIVTVTTPTTVQNWYSFMVESWIAQSSLRNVQFPFTSNGPNSFTLGLGWEWDGTASINLLSHDGMRYTNVSNTVTAIWSAIASVGTMGSLQAKYQQQDGTPTVSTLASGVVDQLIQVYGDVTHGNFDTRSHLVFKVQSDGYYDTTTDVVGIYGALEDQFYVIGLSPILTGLALGAPTVVGTPTITDHGASPVTWNGKQYSITIIDSAGGNTATTLARWLAYNKGLGGTFQGKDSFNWHQLVEANGTSFKTVRGEIYGDTGAALKGVRVVKSDGTTAHTGFNLFTADDGTTYVPPQINTGTVTGYTVGSRVQIYNVTTATELYNAVPGAILSYVYTEGTTVTSGDTIRVRIAYVSGVTANLPEEYMTTAGSIGFTVTDDVTSDAVYNALAIDGSTITEFAADYVNDEVNVVIASNWYMSDLYAWWVYNLTTAQGISDFFGGLEAIDVGNFRINNSVVDIYIDNHTATNLRQLDNRRIFRADEAYPVKSSGGGGIDVVWRNTILIAETGVSGLTAGESAQLMALGTPSDNAAAVGAHEIVSGWSNDRVMRKLAALAVSKTSGNNPSGGTVVIRNLGDTADEMSATVDANGNRTAVTQGP
jgi:hypothetical protein